MGWTDVDFISHFALRVFRRLGFATSPFPREESVEGSGTPVSLPSTPAAESMPTSNEDARRAFELLDRFMATNALTATIARLEDAFSTADRAAAVSAAMRSGFDGDLVESALIVRERGGMLDSLIHAAVITHVIPMILEPGETLTVRPCLGAGNDTTRPYDLETTRRVAEFKVSSWKGRDAMRQRNLFADVVGLSLDETGRRRQMYVVGELPAKFLRESKRLAIPTLSKSALRVRTPPRMTARRR